MIQLEVAGCQKCSSITASFMTLTAFHCLTLSSFLFLTTRMMYLNIFTLHTMIKVTNYKARTEQGELLVCR